ncbi:low molecular weight protein-tyrosine-phosphatase [Litchfieldella anticariensis]|uniref:low molecular weight protein-tyrosine-phosphatase n=1 Tax=Litchfieldella anticariensis TaxID=258591 RepID=UPI0009DBE9A0|nr:low molecular weight protein-tyrosine-phosphatase [Halomonas anticariensis]
MFDSLLVVCRANICRSPVAAAMLRQRLPDHRIQSAGVAALVGHGVEPTARQLGEADGLDLSLHHARQLDATLLGEADLVLVMSESQRGEIGSRWPAALGKTMRLGHWLEDGRGQDIPDPYRKSREAYVHVHRLLATAVDEWQRRLAQVH